MPLYEYECSGCGRRFERIQKFSDPPVDACPTCGGSVRKLPSTPAIQFKGSGFYITDYVRSGNSEGKPDKAADAAGADKGDKGDKGKEKGTGKPAAASPSGEAPAKPEPPKPGTGSSAKE